MSDVRALLHTLIAHGVPSPAAKTAIVIGLFAVAAVASRLLGVLVGRVRERVESVSLESPLIAIARRETAVSLAQTTVRYVVFFIALLLSLVTITGARGVGALAGASFVAVIVGFAAQRFLVDLIAGFVMFFEGWYTIGSTVMIEPWKLEGVVEEVSLRATKIRHVSGEVLRVHNSQILAVRVVPDGGRHVEMELFVRDADDGDALVRGIASLLPQGPTAFIRAPEVTMVTELGDDLYRVTAAATVAVGSTWMAESLLPSLVRERAPADLIVHGPVILPADEQAVRRFERAGRFRRVGR